MTQYEDFIDKLRTHVTPFSSVPIANTEQACENHK